MDELEEIRQKKLRELQNQQEEQAKINEQVQQLESLVKSRLTKEALERYSNVKMAYPEMAMQLLVVIAQSIQSGQIQTIDDNMLKEVLKKIQPEKKEFKIKRM